MARRRKALDWKGQIELSINRNGEEASRSSCPRVRRLQHVRRVLFHEGVSKYLKKSGARSQKSEAVKRRAGGTVQCGMRNT